MTFDFFFCLFDHLINDGGHSSEEFVTIVDVPPHELLESVQEKPELKIGVIVFIVGLQDLHMEEDITGQEEIVPIRFPCCVLLALSWNSAGGGNSM